MVRSLKVICPRCGKKVQKRKQPRDGWMCWECSCKRRKNQDFPGRASEALNVILEMAEIRNKLPKNPIERQKAVGKLHKDGYVIYSLERDGDAHKRGNIG